MRIACVIATIRPEEFKKFREAWALPFSIFDVEVIAVFDGENPTVSHDGREYSVRDIMGSKGHLISNFSSSVKNLGIAYAAKEKFDVVFVMDDDVRPSGDTIADHLKALQMKVPISWFSSTIVKDNTDYMRGFPYGVRDEAEVEVSHGVWTGVPDRDAPNQLIVGTNKQVEFYRGPVPRGSMFPVCGMNLAVKQSILPFLYFAPVSNLPGAERFDDIWMGINLKNRLDFIGKAMVTGYATVEHLRASNVFKSLQREALGIELNETYWSDDGIHFDHPWFEEYEKKRGEWIDFIDSLLENE